MRRSPLLIGRAVNFRDRDRANWFGNADQATVSDLCPQIRADRELFAIAFLALIILIIIREWNRIPLLSPKIGSSG